MAARYKRASQHGLLWTGIILGGLACAVGIAFALGRQAHWSLLLAAFFVPFLASFTLAIWLMAVLKRRRVFGIQTMLERENFIMDIRPDDARKAAVFTPLNDLQNRLDLRNVPGGVQWIALHIRQPSAQCIIEFMHITGSGKSTQQHDHTIIAWLIQPAHSIDTLATYRARRWKKRILKQFQSSIIMLGDDSFDRDWITFGDSASARTFLTDSVRLALAESPKGVSWHIGTGLNGGQPTHWIAAVFDGAFNAHNLARFRRHCEDALQQSGLASTIRTAP